MITQKKTGIFPTSNSDKWFVLMYLYFFLIYFLISIEENLLFHLLCKVLKHVPIFLLLSLFSYCEFCVFLYYLDMFPLSGMWFTNTFSQFVTYLFILLSAFRRAEVFNFKTNLSKFFSIVYCALGVVAQKNLCLTQVTKVFSFVFSQKFYSFYIIHLSLWSILIFSSKKFWIFYSIPLIFVSTFCQYRCPSIYNGVMSR